MGIIDTSNWIIPLIIAGLVLSYIGYSIYVWAEMWDSDLHPAIEWILKALAIPGMIAVLLIALVIAVIYEVALFISHLLIKIIGGR